MARNRNQVFYTRKALQDYPEFGIEKGQSHYWVRVMIEGEPNVHLRWPKRPSQADIAAAKQAYLSKTNN